MCNRVAERGPFGKREREFIRGVSGLFHSAEQHMSAALTREIFYNPYTTDAFIDLEKYAVTQLNFFILKRIFIKLISIRSIPVRRIFEDLNKKEPSWYDTGCQIVDRNGPY
jgi:hypothetical protein